MSGVALETQVRHSWGRHRTTLSLGGKGQVAEGSEGPLGGPSGGDGNVLSHNCSGSRVTAY